MRCAFAGGGSRKFVLQGNAVVKPSACIGHMRLRVCRTGGAVSLIANTTYEAARSVAGPCLSVLTGYHADTPGEQVECGPHGPLLCDHDRRVCAKRTCGVDVPVRSRVLEAGA